MYNIHRTANRLNDFDSKIFQDVFKKQRALINPIDLSVGYPEGSTPQHIKDAGIRAIQEDLTVYAPANGIPELREALAGKLLTKNNINISMDAISVVPGLTTGLLLVYLAVLNPGDEVMIIDPGYPPYFHLAPIAGATAKRIPTLPNFQLDLAAIEANITPKTKLLVINSPNNPTGAVYPQQDLEQLAKIGTRHNLLIVSDEIYEDFVFEGSHFSLGSIYANTITMGGFSKSHAMTGWRLGYICGPQDIIDAINQLQQYIVFSSSSIAQYAVLDAFNQPLPHRGEYVLKNKLVKSELEKAGYRVYGSEGAYYTLFQVPRGMTDLEFVDLAAEKNLLLLPGRAFSQQETFVRLSYGATIEDVKKGLDIITEITNQAR